MHVAAAYLSPLGRMSMSKPDQQILDMVNRSGFLFQLAIEHAIKSKLKSDGISIAASEHPWTDTRTGETGFIDLIVEAGFARFVIECKRPKGGKWFFLAAEDSDDQNPHGRITWATKLKDDREIVAVDDLLLFPKSFESSICIIRAEGEDERTLLERYAGKLLASVNAVAQEEVRYPRNQFYPGYIYIPVIVTTASINVAKIDPEKISLADGTITDLNFQSVPHLKFRKSLVTEHSELSAPSDLYSSNKNKERTVVVVNSESLLELLQGTNVRANSGELPWIAINRKS